MGTETQGPLLSWIPFHLSFPLNLLHHHRHCLLSRESPSHLCSSLLAKMYFFLTFVLNATCDIKKENCAWSSLDKHSDLNLSANQRNLAAEFMLFTLGKSESENVSPIATPCTVAGQAPPSVRFFRQDYRSGLPCPPLGDLPVPRIEPVSPASQADSLWSEPPGKPF